MYKTMTTFGIREGIDPDKFWKYHTEVHSVEAKGVAGPGLKKYVINRVVGVMSGTPGFFGLVEMWWESKEALDERNKKPTDKHSLEDWIAHGGVQGFKTHVEEVEITKLVGPKPKNMCKIMGAYRLPPGTNGDEFWKYHTTVHGLEVKKAAGNLLPQYFINRHVDNLMGQTPFFGAIEMWWKDKQAMADYPNVAKNFKGASGKNPMDDWHSHNPIDVFGVILDEVEIPM